MGVHERLVRALFVWECGRRVCLLLEQRGRVAIVPLPFLPDSHCGCIDLNA